MRLEDILPEVRKGRKHKQKSWSETYAMFDTSDHSYGVYTNAGGFIELMELEGDDLLADDWELVPELVRVADYLVPNLVGDYYHKETYPIGQQPEGAVMVPNSEREESK